MAWYGVFYWILTANDCLYRVALIRCQYIAIIVIWEIGITNVVILCDMAQTKVLGRRMNVTECCDSDDGSIKMNLKLK